MEYICAVKLGNNKSLSTIYYLNDFYLNRIIYLDDLYELNPYALNLCNLSMQNQVIAAISCIC